MSPLVQSCTPVITSTKYLGSSEKGTFLYVFNDVVLVSVCIKLLDKSERRGY